MKALLPAAFALSVLALAAPVRAEPGDGIVGTWLTSNGEAKIRFAKENNVYVGRVVWLKTPTKNGQPITDEKNPDPALRARKMMGAPIVWGMRFEGNGSYGDGRCYDPESGSTYKGKATLETANKLTLRGYVGVPLFGRSDSWQRTD